RRLLHRAMTRRITPLVAAFASACGPAVPIDDAGETSTGTPGATTVSITIGTTITASTTTTDPMTTATTIDPSTDTTLDTSSGGRTTYVDFIFDPDGGSDDGGCDPWAQDCLRGDKCMPWANDGSNRWNDVRCSPAGSGQLGDPCTVEGSSVSGLD